MTDKECECHGVSGVEHNPNEIDKLAKIRKWITEPNADLYEIGWLPAARYLLSELDRVNQELKDSKAIIDILPTPDEAKDNLIKYLESELDRMRKLAYEVLG